MGLGFCLEKEKEPESIQGLDSTKELYSFDKREKFNDVNNEYNNENNKDIKGPRLKQNLVEDDSIYKNYSQNLSPSSKAKLIELEKVNELDNIETNNNLFNINMQILQNHLNNNEINELIILVRRFKDINNINKIQKQIESIENAGKSKSQTGLGKFDKISGKNGNNELTGLNKVFEEIDYFPELEPSFQVKINLESLEISYKMHNEFGSLLKPTVDINFLNKSIIINSIINTGNKNELISDTNTDNNNAVASDNSIIETDNSTLHKNESNKSFPKHINKDNKIFNFNEVILELIRLITFI